MICPGCGVEFEPKHAGRRWCSRECYRRSYKGDSQMLSGAPSSLSQFLRESLMELHGYKCQDCGVEIPRQRDKYHRGCLHHIIPLSDGGQDIPSNITLLCHKCHARRHAEIRKNRNSNKLDKTGSKSEKYT